MTPALKLSTAQKKRTHPWRHASQRPKKMAICAPLPWDSFSKSYLHTITMEKTAHRSYAYTHYYDEGLREAWDAWNERRGSVQALEDHFTAFEFGLCIQAAVSQSMAFGHEVETFLTMICHHTLDVTHAPANLAFFTDGMAALAQIRERLNIPEEHQVAIKNIQSVLHSSEATIAFFLRRQLCAVDDATYEAVHTHARAQFGTQDEAFDAFLALSFPDEVAWGNACIDRLLEHASPPHRYTEFYPLMMLSTGADMQHIMAIYEAGLLHTIRYTEGGHWGNLFDLVVTHDDAMLPLIASLLKHPRSMLDLYSLELSSIAMMTHEPEIVIALSNCMLHSFISSSKLTQKLLTHLAKTPELILAHFPELLARAAPTNGQHEPMSKLLERLLHEQEALKQEHLNEEDYISEEEVPRALRELPWHTSKKIRQPKLPVFWRPLSYPELLVRENPARRLPKDLYDDIGRIFMLGDREEAQAARSTLSELIDETSLGQFCWHLFMDWRDVNSPVTHIWVFEAFVLHGTMELVCELPKILNAWLGGKFDKRARAMIETLTPSSNAYTYEMLDAMMHGSYADGAAIARAKLERFATAHFEEDPCVEDLLDAISPRLGLSDARKLELDPTAQIEVVLDAELDPHLRSTSGKAVTLEPTIALRWERLKRRQSQLAQSLSRRFEYALTTQRRWRLDRWRAHIATHPLLSCIAERLIWCTFDNKGKPLQLWRMDESRECVDVEDVPLTFATDTHRIGLAHPLHMTRAQRQAWLGVLTDYEIIQPFEQITREYFEDPPRHEQWLELYGKRTTHEKLHELFMRHDWHAIQSTMNTLCTGYGIRLRLGDGKETRREFKLQLKEWLHRAGEAPEKVLTLEKCVNLKRIKWQEVNAIERSEVLRGLRLAFLASSDVHGASH